MGLGQALSEEFVVEGGVPVTETLKSLHIIPPTGHARGRVHPRRGAAARGPVRREGHRRGRARADRRGGRGRAHAFDGDPPHAAADEGLARRARRRPASRPARQGSCGDDRHVARPGHGSSTATSGSSGGRIAAPGQRRPDRLPTACLVLPGNVCAHTHLYSALARGMPYALEPPRELPPDPPARLVAARPRARRGARSAHRRSSAGWRRCSPGRRRSSTTTPRRTRSTARST